MEQQEKQQATAEQTVISTAAVEKDYTPRTIGKWVVLFLEGVIIGVGAAGGEHDGHNGHTRCGTKQVAYRHVGAFGAPQELPCGGGLY